jgi:hypothetical protein
MRIKIISRNYITFCWTSPALYLRKYLFLKMSAGQRSPLCLATTGTIHIKFAAILCAATGHGMKRPEMARKWNLFRNSGDTALNFNKKIHRTNQWFSHWPCAERVEHHIGSMDHWRSHSTPRRGAPDFRNRPERRTCRTDSRNWSDQVKWSLSKLPSGFNCHSRSCQGKKGQI